MKHSKSEIDSAIEHIADGERDIAEPRARIERLRESGQSLGTSEQLLKLIETAVNMRKSRLAKMLAENKLEN